MESFHCPVFGNSEKSLFPRIESNVSEERVSKSGERCSEWKKSSGRAEVSDSRRLSLCSNLDGSKKKDGGRFRFRNGIFDPRFLLLGSVQHFSCRVLGSNKSCKDFIWTPDWGFSLRTSRIWWAPVSDRLLFSCCCWTLPQLFSCFCRYFRWLTFLLDFGGLSKAILILLDATSTKFSKELVDSLCCFMTSDRLSRTWNLYIRRNFCKVLISILTEDANTQHYSINWGKMLPIGNFGWEYPCFIVMLIEKRHSRRWMASKALPNPQRNPEPSHARDRD